MKKIRLLSFLFCAVLCLGLVGCGEEPYLSVNPDKLECFCQLRLDSHCQRHGAHRDAIVRHG